MRFPEKLEKELARSGKSQSAIERETGLRQSAISGMTRGTRRPYMDQALLLARALGVPLDYLADDAVDDRPAAAEMPADERKVLEHYRYLRDRSGGLLTAEEVNDRMSQPVPRTGAPLYEPMPGQSYAEIKAAEEAGLAARKGAGRKAKGPGEAPDRKRRGAG